MKIPRMLYRFGSFAALALIFALGSRIAAAQSPDSEHISKLLAEAKSHAVLAEDDVAKLESFTRVKVDSHSHARKLEQIRDHVNGLGKVTQQLVNLRVEGSPWQQKAIDQIDPLMHEMANLLTTTINHMNENPAGVEMQPYRDYVQANLELATKAAEMIRDLVDYDEARSKAESLEAKIDVATEKTE